MINNKYYDMSKEKKRNVEILKVIIATMVFEILNILICFDGIVLVKEVLFINWSLIIIVCCSLMISSIIHEFKKS